MAGGVQVVLQNAQPAKALAEQADIGRGRRDAHQAAKREAWHCRNGGGQRRQFFRRDAALAGLRLDHHLQADVERRQRGRALGGQPLGEAQPVHRMDPVEMLGGGPRLVGLQLADEVPDGAGGRHCHLLVERFLQIVLAEIGLAKGADRRNRGCRLGLGNRYQRDRTGRPAGGGRSPGQPISYRRQVSRPKLRTR